MLLGHRLIQQELEGERQGRRIFTEIFFQTIKAKGMHGWIRSLPVMRE